MRDRRHNEKSGGHQICSPGIVQLAERWETGAKMGNRGLGIGKQREEKKKIIQAVIRLASNDLGLQTVCYVHNILSIRILGWHQI